MIASGAGAVSALLVVVEADDAGEYVVVHEFEAVFQMYRFESAGALAPYPTEIRLCEFHLLHRGSRDLTSI